MNNVLQYLASRLREIIAPTSVAEVTKSITRSVERLDQLSAAADARRARLSEKQERLLAQQIELRSESFKARRVGERLSQLID